MRAAIVGGLVMTSLAAFVFACGSDDNNNSSNNNNTDAGTTTTTRPPTTTSDAGSTTTFPTTYAGCGVFPRDSAWNQDVSTLAVDTALTQVLTDNYDGDTIGINFGRAGDELGYIINKGAAATTQAAFRIYNDTERAQIDKVACPAGTTADTCYPIPLTSKSTFTKNDSKYLLFLDTTGAPNNCTVYEVADLSQVEAENDVEFTSKWPLNSSALKTVQFRSTSLSGTSIFAGLLKREDVTKGTVTHALRVTMPSNRIRNAFVSPATHSNATRSDTERFPMGTRLRLKASVAETEFTGDALIIVRGLKKYGVIVADDNNRAGNSSQPIVIDGEQDESWNVQEDSNGLSSTLGDKVKITDFEVVNTNQAAVTQTH